jgi:hypothetical protein
MPHKPPVFDLTNPCPKCGYRIPPAEILRPSFDHVRCPKCGATFEPGGADAPMNAPTVPRYRCVEDTDFLEFRIAGMAELVDAEACISAHLRRGA